jgi:Zn finger protein HypA/HybF involved in hydrogenase expression
MALISETYQKEKLKRYGINIRTKYIVGNKILERNTNDSVNDNIERGIRCQKEYYIDNKLAHKEKLFDSRIEYTYIMDNNINEEYECPNCGMKSPLKDFIDGCPYCKTYYNMDYSEKDLGSKYHYDRVLKSNIYRVITLIVDIIISIIISFIFIKLTSRTFNNYDIIKIFIYGIILSLILYYFFYIADAYIILSPIKKFKDKENKKQIEFWKRTKINKKTFFNNLNYEIRKKYYSKENIIDYDILDYTNFKDYEVNGVLYVDVTADLRIVTYENKKLKSKIITQTYTMKQNKNTLLNLGTKENIIRCANCGASIDVTKGKCEYCHSEIKYLQEWILEEKV